jgi:hypothetical protein
MGAVPLSSISASSLRSGGGVGSSGLARDKLLMGLAAYLDLLNLCFALRANRLSIEGYRRSISLRIDLQ